MSPPIVSRLLFAVALAVPLAARAQAPAYPSKPIRLITLTPSGGALDITARTIAQRISATLGQPVLVEPRTGAGGNVGADAVAKAAPDGYTIGMCTSSTHGINPSLYGARMPFDAVRDFAPITVVAELNNVVVVHPDLPINDIPGLVAHAKANPGRLAFGSAGSGTSQHLSGELFKMMTGTEMVHVPYRGAAVAVPDLLAGQIQLMFVSIPDVLSHIRSGRLRAIGVTAGHRAATLPDARPVSEQGLPEFNVTAWFGIVAPAATPREIVARLHKEITAALAQADVREKLASVGLDPASSPAPEAFATFIRSEIDRWGKVVKASGAKAD